MLGNHYRPGDILTTISRDPLFGLKKNEYIEKLKLTLSGRVKLAYIFGSFTGERFGKFSDIDILLVTDTAKPFVERSFDFHDLLNIVPTTDILVYTESEFAALMSESTLGFWKSVKESMVRII